MGAAKAAMCALAALLACLCLEVVAQTPQSSNNPVPSHGKSILNIPDGKAHLYKYSAVVSAGQNEPTSFASKLQIRGRLILKSVGDSDKYMRFLDVKHRVYNGPNEGDSQGEYQAIEDGVKDFEKPFLAVYDGHELRGIKLQENEATWSKNTKRSLASLMQLNTRRFTLNDTMKPLSFHSEEVTLYGRCTVDYNVYSKLRDGKRLYYVHKSYEPRSCGSYVAYEVSDGKSGSCKAEPEEDLVSMAEKTYVFEYVDDNLVLTKVTSYEKLSYLPYLHRGFGVQYIETKQTFEFRRVVDQSELNLPATNFEKVPLETDVVFDGSDFIPRKYEKKGDVLVEENQFGRSTVEQKELIAKTKEHLLGVQNYLKENQIDVKKVHPEQSDVLGKLYQTMSHMNSDSLIHIHKHFNKESEKGNMTRKIFLQMVTHTGTFAAWNFTLTVINEEEVEESEALDMLAKLPMYIRKPTTDFAELMEPFLYLDDNKATKSVSNAGILCYSILLHKIYKNIKSHEVPDHLRNLLVRFNSRLNYEPTYQMKILYMMAMRNVEVGGIYQYLAPIVRGDYEFFVTVDIDKPEKYRTAAMWAVAKSISSRKELTYELFWPILANSSEPLTVRLTAYEQLISRNPNLDMHLLMHVHALMEQERDPHVANYHYTTLRHTAESTDPCTSGSGEMMRKVLRLTKRRKSLSAMVSRVKMYDYYDSKYGHGKSFRIGAQIDEASGIPQTGYYEVTSTFRRRSTAADGWYWNIDGYNMNAIIKFMNKLAKEESGIELNESSFKISDERVRNLLFQTHGYKLSDKHIHLEFWTMNKGYVTNVQVYFENSLVDILKKLREDHKPENLMDAGDKFNLNYLYISNLNHYNMIVPTDLGLPAFFTNVVPYMTYVKINPNIFPLKTIRTMKLEFESKFYHESSYKMKFYNPFADVSHAVQRRATTDAALPIDVTFSFSMETYTLKMVLPRMPETKFSVAGVRVYSVDQVTIENDHKNTLKTHCPACNHVTDVSLDPSQKKQYGNVYHSVDTGLEYTTTVFDCDAEHEMTLNKQELHRVFNTQKNNYNTEMWPMFLMIADQALFNFMNTPYAGTCGTMFKVAPCAQHPTSHIEMNWRFNGDKMSTENSKKFNVRGTIDTKAASLNQTVRFWDVDLMMNINQFWSHLKLGLTKKTPGEKNLKICLEVEKKYPNILTNAATIDHQTHTSVLFMMGESDDEDCKTNDNSAVIKISMKGELLNEQLEQMKNNVKQPGSCFRNPLNPLDLDITKRFDWNCLYEAVKGTTMRDYSISIYYKNISHELISKFIILDDYLRFDNSPLITYKPDHTEPGNVEIHATYSPNDNLANISVAYPFFSYELTDVRYGSDDKEDRSNDLIFDNTGFSSIFLIDFYKGDIRPCIAHANDVITDLNQTVPIDFKDWTLMYGDHSIMSFAIFAKTVGENKMAVRVYSRSHILEIQPGKSSPFITLDGIRYDIATYISEELTSELEESNFKISMMNQLYLIETKDIANVKVYYTPYNVIVMPHIILARCLDGICGHMGSTMYKQQVPLVLASD